MSICTVKDLEIFANNYIFDSSQIDCGNYNYIFQKDPLKVQFIFSDLQPFPARLYLKTSPPFDGKISAPYTYLQGSLVKEGRRFQDMEDRIVFDIEHHFNENKTIELIHSEREFIVNKAGIEYKFSMVPYFELPITTVDISLIKNNVSTDGLISNKIQNISKNNPEIFIISQYLIDWSDIGETTFEVKQINQHKKFTRSCPKIVSVLKGKGSTASDKMNYIYQKKNVNISGINFRDNLVKYSMLKYFLCKILYGKWNIQFLLGKYHKKFIKDLQNSDFNTFVEFFINPESDVYDYVKYFLYDN